MKNLNKKGILVATLLLATGINAQQLRSSHSSNSVGISLKPSAACSILIPPYSSQVDGGNGNTSQIFEASNTAYNNELADDFTAPTGTNKVCRVKILGSTSSGGNLSNDPDAKFILTVYSNTGNLPGTVVFSEIYTLATVYNSSTQVVDMPVSISHVITPGQKYWVSVRAQAGFALGGQWYWTNSNATQQGEKFVWRNPGNGFSSGCTTWTDASACMSTFGPDLYMLVEFSDILGTKETVTNSIFAYPNPATTEVRIATRKGEVIQKVFVTDLSGKTIELTANKGIVNLSKLTRGNYILTIETNQGISSQKLIKQ